MKTRNKNPIVVEEEPLFNKSSMFSPLVLGTVKKKIYFHPLIDSVSFGTVDYDANINGKVDYSTNHIFKSMTSLELNE